MPGACWQAVRKEQTNLANHQCEQLEDQATSCTGYRSNLHFLPESIKSEGADHTLWNIPLCFHGQCLDGACYHPWVLACPHPPEGTWSPWMGLPWLTLACPAPQPLWDKENCSWVNHSNPTIHWLWNKKGKKKAVSYYPDCEKVTLY